MDDFSQQLIEETIATLRKKGAVEVTTKMKKYGYKITTSEGVTVKVYDMNLYVNDELKDSRPTTVIVDNRISALTTYRIFSSFETTPRAFFFDNE